MSDRIKIEAEPRTVVGKKVKQLRREGLVPGVVYGKQEPVAVQMPWRELRRALRVVSTSHLANLDIAGDQRTVLVREIQQHLTRGDIMHVDFLEVDMLQTITSEAELVATGEAGPTAEGLGVATLTLRSIEIECLPDNLISEIAVDFARIVMPDDVIYVSDLVAPEGVTILTDPETVVARFEYVGLEEEEEAVVDAEFFGAADAVEVISKGKEEEFEK